MAWHVSLDRWRLIHPVTRAQMVACYLHKGQREAFINDWSFKSATEKGKSKSKDDGYDRMMRSMH